MAEHSQEVNLDGFHSSSSTDYGAPSVPVKSFKLNAILSSARMRPHHADAAAPATDENRDNGLTVLTSFERLGRLGTVSSLAKARSSSLQRVESKRRVTSSPSSALLRRNNKQPVESVEDRTAAVARSSESTTSGVRRPDAASPKSAAVLSTSNSPLPSPTLAKHLSSSVLLMGVGSHRDNKILAVHNAELRKQLRELREQNRKHLVDQQQLEQSKRHDDSFDVIEQEAEEVGNTISVLAREYQNTSDDMYNLEEEEKRLRREIDAERMARNSVQRVLFERSSGFEDWKKAIVLERQRHDEAEMNHMLQRQMAAATAGERGVRPPHEVRAEREHLFEFVSRLKQEAQRLQDHLTEVDAGISEAKQRASELLIEDDRLDDRMTELRRYIESARKVLQANH